MCLDADKFPGLLDRHKVKYALKKAQLEKKNTNNLLSGRGNTSKSKQNLLDKMNNPNLEQSGNLNIRDFMKASCGV